MKKLFFLASLAVLNVCAAESPAESMRGKLRAKILEGLPSRPSIPTGVALSAGDPPVLMPAVIACSFGARNAELRITREEVKPSEPRFSPVSGGTFYAKNLGRVRAKAGGWWNPLQGWSFLNFSW